MIVIYLRMSHMNGPFNLKRCPVTLKENGNSRAPHSLAAKLRDAGVGRIHTTSNGEMVAIHLSCLHVESTHPHQLAWYPPEVSLRGKLCSRTSQSGSLSVDGGGKVEIKECVPSESFVNALWLSLKGSCQQPPWLRAERHNGT